MSEGTIIPTDAFSRRRRELQDNPGALGAGSTVHLTDFYGNAESWIIESFRIDGKTVAFLQRMSASEPLRVLLPEGVMGALARQDAQLVARGRRRAARTAAATREARGIKPTFSKRVSSPR